MTRTSLALALLLSLLVVPTGARESDVARDMREAAARFLAALDEGQRAKATFEFGSDERLNWHFIPRERKGLPFYAMTDAQRTAATALLRAGSAPAASRRPIAFAISRTRSASSRRRRPWSRSRTRGRVAIASATSSRSSARPRPTSRGAGATRVITSRRTGRSSAARRWRAARSSSAAIPPKSARGRCKGLRVLAARGGSRAHVPRLARRGPEGGARSSAPRRRRTSSRWRTPRGRRDRRSAASTWDEADRRPAEAAVARDRGIRLRAGAEARRRADDARAKATSPASASHGWVRPTRAACTTIGFRAPGS